MTLSYFSEAATTSFSGRPPNGTNVTDDTGAPRRVRVTRSRWTVQYTWPPRCSSTFSTAVAMNTASARQIAAHGGFSMQEQAFAVRTVAGVMRTASRTARTQVRIGGLRFKYDAARRRLVLRVTMTVGGQAECWCDCKTGSAAT